MSTLSQFAAGGIKSVQRGTISFFGTPTIAVGATINSVDVSKTMVNYLGQTGYYLGSSSNPLDGIGLSRLSLDNSTTVTATRSDTNTYTHVVSYEVIEFY